MMKKQFMTAVLAGAMMFSLGACGTDADAIWYGTVTGSEGTTGNRILTEIASGMESYGQSQERQTRLYTASENSLEGYTAQFEAAAAEKVKVVMANGSDMETAVYEAQNAHHGIKYVLFNGEPRKDGAETSEIRKNTTVITFKDYDMGYLAGYAAVREGYRSLGYLTGEEKEKAKESYEGFLAGCEAAAAELQLERGAVVLNQEYAGDDALMPLRMTEAMSWYNAGTELIATDCETLMPAIAKAADVMEKKAAAVGFDYAGSSANVSYSAVPDYAGATGAILAASAKAKTFGGGSVQVYGFSQHAIGLNADFTQFANFTESVYNSFIETAQVLNADQSTAESVSGNQSGLVTVNVMQPAGPDAAAGLTNGIASGVGEASDSGVSSTAEAVDTDNVGDTSAEAGSTAEAGDEE